MNELLNPRSIQALRLSPNDRVLDVGAGDGRLAREMAAAVGSDGLVVGVERDREQIGLAADDESGDDLAKVELRCGDALALPLNEDEWGTFDVVHARFLLEHVLEPGKVVAQMVRAARPGGRIVLEDDDHDLLRLWPESSEFEIVWDAYIEAWDGLGSDPFVGRRQVHLLHEAGAKPVRNDLLFFGSCAGDEGFADLVANFSSVVKQAGEEIVKRTDVDRRTVRRGLEAFSLWAERPDAAFWYATCWVEGRRPEKVAEKPRRRREGRRSKRQMLGIPQHTVATTDESWSSLGLGVESVEALQSIGFEHPTPIQSLVIPRALTGVDLIGLAQTGSGKTAAFCLPVAERVETGGGVRGLILCPTREIAMQTKTFLEVFGEERGLESADLIGGVKIDPQIRKLRRGTDIVVATPGRLLDHIRRGTINVDGVRELVLDEADHMLDLGFLPQIRAVLEALPAQRQTLMFSATMPPPIENLARRFLKDPERIDLLPTTGTAEGIEHRLYLVEEPNKKPCLLQLVADEPGSVLVFLRRKIDADWACRQLEIEGHPVERLHSGLSQRQRDAALEGFRAGEHRVLVATDVAARGIDIPRIEHIINFDPPQTVDDYIHRAGRTARGALQGTVSTIATWDAKPLLSQIEVAIGRSLPRCEATGVDAYVEPRRRDPMRRRLR